MAGSHSISQNNTAATFGASVGKLGFGFMRVPTEKGLGIDHGLLHKMVDRFLEAGFTYFDTAYAYGGSEEALREALVKRHPAGDYTITTKMPVFRIKKQSDMIETFEVSMERLGIDYLDHYLLHGLTLEVSDKLENMGAWEFMRGLKSQGRIGHYGFSFHDTPENLDKILTRHPDTEFVQLQINYLDWDAPDVQSRRLYETARKYGMPFTIMGPVKGGLLSGGGSLAEKALREVDPGASAASWAVRFAAALDGLVTMLSGMGTMEQLEDNIRTIQNLKPLSDEELATLRSVADLINSVPRIQCTGCKYCIDNCPQELKIPELVALYNEFIAYGQKRSIGYPFEEAAPGGRLPSTCTGCRSCEAHCPQHIEISGVMRKTADVFE